MNARFALFSAVLLTYCVAPVAAIAQNTGDLASGTESSVTTSSLTPVSTGTDGSAVTISPAVHELMSFKDSDVKFDVSRLMDILSDRRHEGWVLAAYPDPKTAQPLIGAGFSLDLPAREHPQPDPLNPHPFLEPSSADLWQAAGLDPAKLQTILGEFHDRLDTLSKAGFRRQLRDLPPQITDQDANALLRVGIIQAIYNAKGYCRNFDHLSGPQQMAMAQLVYQMGINLQEFSQFLGLVNRDVDDGAKWSRDAAYWKTVQQSLMHSQWARLYRARATAVIAMLNPRYEANPTGAERSVGAVLRPARGRHARHSSARLRSATYSKRGVSAAHRRKARTRAD